MFIYLDESGDLGFSEGGTQYFAIVFIITETPDLIKRAVKRTKTKFFIPSHVEIKGSSTRGVIREDLLKRLNKLEIEIHAITVKKENVKTKLREDANLLYNYMVGLSLVERILREPTNAKVVIVVDRRTTSITSGFRFNEYIRYKIWYEAKRGDIDLDFHHIDSHRAYGNMRQKIFISLIRLEKESKATKDCSLTNKKAAPTGD